MTDAPTDTDAPTEDTDDTRTGDDTDLSAEVDRLRGELAKARKWEDRAKANSAAAKELEQLRQQSMTEQERAVAAARSEAEAEMARRFAGRIVDAEVKAAAAGRSVDVEALLEGLDRTRFLGDDGEPDTAAIAAWVDRIAPQPSQQDDPTPQRKDLGQGTSRAMALNGDPIERSLRAAIGA